MWSVAIERAAPSERRRIAIDVESGVPIYVQLVACIKQLVAGGLLQPGEQLPTMRQLATDLRINYNTVGRAYMILDQEGVISTQQGRGTYIASRLTEEQIRRLRMDKLRSLVDEAVHEAQTLGYSQDEVRQTFEAAMSVFMR